jgi:hypothetical protein
MKLSKPHKRIEQAATQVKVLSPVSLIVTKVDAIHYAGRQHWCGRNGRDHTGFVGVLGRGMLEDGFGVNLGDLRGTSMDQASEYRSTRQKSQGNWDCRVEVGFAHSTLSAGKPRTWGRGKRDEASEESNSTTAPQRAQVVWL